MDRSLVALAALLAASTSTAALADTLVDHANGIQVDATGKLERFTGMLIGKDGRVVKLLAKDDARPAKVDARIDAGGKVLMPGLIDAHGHVVPLGLALIQLDLTGSRSITELQTRLKTHAAASKGKGWIIGRGWNQEMFSEGRFPTTADLDAAVSDRPVWLVRVDGHAAVANSAAVRATNMANAKAPSGGRIENGLFVDAARDMVEAKIPAPTAAMLDDALLKSQEALLSVGLTAAADMGTSAADWKSLRKLGNSGKLKIRVLSYALGTDTLTEVAGSKPTPWLYGDHLRMGGVKLYADGALGSRGAWLKAPYHDMPSTRGLSLIDDATLRQKISLAAKGGFQIAVHAIGDAANAQVVGAFEDMAAQFKGDRRWRLEHAQILDPVDRPRLARTGIIASMQPTHQTSDRTMAEARLGPDRLDGAYAWESIAESGAHLAFGSDFPVESPNPFPGLAAAVSRQDMSGEPQGGWRPQERVSIERALAGFTREAAFAGFAEDRLGSLDPGRHADFILIDRDPTNVGPAELARTQVLETWVDGKKVWQRALSAAATPAR